ncbi:DEDDh family exonuclease [Streptomyces alkaliphilus]|uniref:DEDDh family exonuclease n=1 Tax=Streptomyces alkaliphilus TaxID=1472722 RepID=UPI00117F7548|nr:DEDDh family exonuclease [Streptomyces alkaliphilus]MQS09889.1 DEDDh family exonuclease [Streptomyces alkaliphilus]
MLDDPQTTQTAGGRRARAADPTPAGGGTPVDAERSPLRWPDGFPPGYAVVDVETTGLDPRDRVVSVAVYRVDRRGLTQDHWYTPVNPERDPGPVHIHGLTAEMLEAAPRFPEIVEELSERLTDRVLVAHNALFDWRMLSREYARAGRRAPVTRRLCTIALAKELSLPVRNHRLETLAAHYGVRQERAHHALDDARVLTEILRPGLERAARLGLELPLQECRPVTRWREGAADPATVPGGGRRPARRREPCPHPNPGRWEPGSPLVQGMRVAFSGDTSVERELLEDQTHAAGLHVASSVSGQTSLLVTNYPTARTGKVRRALELGTPVIDEAGFTRLLGAVAPAVEG